MSALLLKLLPLLSPLLPYLGGLAVAAGATALIAFLVKRRATAQLAGAVPVLEDLATAELKVLASDISNPKAIPGDAAKAAGDVLKADAGQLVTTAKAELDVLATPATTTAVTDGGATVNLPSRSHMRLAPFLGGAAVVALAFVLGAVLPDPAANLLGLSTQVSVTTTPVVVVLPQKTDAGPDNFRFWCDNTTVLCGYALFDGGPTFIDGGPVGTTATYDAGCDGGLDSPYDAGCTFEGFGSDAGQGLGQDGGYVLGSDAGPVLGTDGGYFVDGGVGGDAGYTLDGGPSVWSDGGPVTIDGGPFSLDGGPIWDSCLIGDGGPWYGFPSYCFFTLDAGYTVTQLNLDGGNQQFDAGCKNALNPGTPLTAGLPEVFQPGLAKSAVILVTFDAGGTCFITDLSQASQ